MLVLIQAFVSVGSVRAATNPVPNAVAKPNDFIITPPWATGKEHRIVAGYAGDSPLHQHVNDTSKANDYYALDFDLALDEAVYPIAEGVVRFAGEAKGGWANYGTIVFIDHNNGFQSLYAHLQHTDVTTGQTVDPSIQLGGAGNSGTTEIHLHLSLYKGASFQFTDNGIGPYAGQAVVPEPFASCQKNSSQICENLLRSHLLIRTATQQLPMPVADSSATIDYFALGDSIAAGHGLQDTGEPCRRSRYSYPYRVALELTREYGNVSFPAEHHLACTGAKANKPAKADLDKDPNKWLVSQVDYVLDHLDPSRSTIVSIGIGANDFGWANPEIIKQRLYFDDDETYAAWVATTVAAVKKTLKAQVERLLRHRHVGVILVEYHNPFNRESVFFNADWQGATNLLLRDRCAGLLRLCYQRTEDAIHLLNSALLEIYIELHHPERLQITAIHVASHGHESPRADEVKSRCGTASPTITDSWVQYRDDPNSNSFPSIGANVAGSELWIGDCFHLNIFGSVHFARAVFADAQRLMPSVMAQRIDMLAIQQPSPMAIKAGEQREITIIIQNYGQVDWPAGSIVFRRISGTDLGADEMRISSGVPRGALIQLQMKITAPPQTGSFDSTWKLIYEGNAFGDEIGIRGVVIPKESTSDYQAMFEQWLADSWKQARGEADKFWAETQRKLEEAIREAIIREIQQQLRALCATVPVGVLLVGGFVGWRHRRRLM